MGAVERLVKRKPGWVSAVRQVFGRLLSPVVLSVFVLAAIAAAPAAADSVQSVSINGMSARQCGTQGDMRVQYCIGSAPLVTIDGIHTAGTGGAGRQMTVINDERAPDVAGSDEITAVDARSDPQAGSNGWFRQAVMEGDSIPIGYCDPGEGPSITCDSSAAYASSVDILWYTFGDSHPSVNVEFNFGMPLGPCAGPAAPGGGSAADSARVADDNCTPPSHTKITSAKIHRNSAFFRFTARHATGFECELFRNKRMMFRHSCHSPKPYASPLPHGHYLFVVTGVNHAGIDQKPARKKFTIK